MAKPGPTQETQQRVLALRARRPTMSEAGLARHLDLGREVVSAVLIMHGLKEPRKSRPREVRIYRTAGGSADR